MVLRLHQHNTGYTADGFYRSDDPPNRVKALGWLVIQTGLSLTRLTSPCYNNTTCMQILYKKIIKHTQSTLSTVSELSEMKPNLADRTCELLKWLCNYRKLHNTTTRVVVCHNLRDVWPGLKDDTQRFCTL